MFVSAIMMSQSDIYTVNHQKKRIVQPLIGQFGLRVV